MTETAGIDGRNKKNGQFVKGFKGGPGRKVGSRSKLSEAFATDLKLAWERYGVDALERVARDDPATLVKVIASLLPKDIRLDHAVTIEPGEFIDRYRQARALLGNGKVIDHER
jgi:hypothetical protein